MSKPNKRTPLQNKSGHKYFDLLAEALNSAGHDMRHTLKAEIDIPWTKESVKDFLFRPIMRAMFDVESTTELTTKQISEVYEVLNRHTAQKLGVSVDWPQDNSDLDAFMGDK